MAKTLPRLKFCGLHLLNLEEARDTRWDRSHLLVSLKNGLPGLPGLLAEEFRAAIQDGLNNWASVCNLTFEMVDDNSRANILIDCGRIDGPSNTLAWSYLPPANPVNQMYDTGEKAWIRDAQGKRIAIDAVAVITHELGHAIGLQHDSQQGALMSAYYDPLIRKPTKRDVARIQGLYGPPTTPPPPDPGFDEPAVMIILGKSGKETYRASLTRTQPRPRLVRKKKDVVRE